MPAVAATSPDQGPAASTMVRASSRPPERSVTALGASFTTSSATYCAPSSRALRRKACISAGPSNQPSLAMPCDASRTPSSDIQGKRARKSRRIEQLDRTALAFLNGVIGPQHGLARRACQEEIAGFLQPEIDAQKLGRLAQEADAVARQVNVERRGELLADRAGRQRRRGARIGRIALDDDDAAGEVGVDSPDDRRWTSPSPRRRRPEHRTCSRC